MVDLYIHILSIVNILHVSNLADAIIQNDLQEQLGLQGHINRCFQIVGLVTGPTLNAFNRKVTCSFVKTAQSQCAHCHI